MKNAESMHIPFIQKGMSTFAIHCAEKLKPSSKCLQQQKRRWLSPLVV